MLHTHHSFQKCILCRLVTGRRCRVGPDASPTAPQIQSGLVTVAKFDGRHPSLACATTGGRILIHSPHEKVRPAGATRVDVMMERLMPVCDCAPVAGAGADWGPDHAVPQHQQEPHGPGRRWAKPPRHTGAVTHAPNTLTLIPTVMAMP
jgi:hypothetical protein